MVVVSLESFLWPASVHFSRFKLLIDYYKFITLLMCNESLCQFYLYVRKCLCFVLSLPPIFCFQVQNAYIYFLDTGIKALLLIDKLEEPETERI